MEQYISKSALLNEIKKRYEYWREKEFNSHSTESEIRMSECQHLMLLLNNIEVKDVDSENSMVCKVDWYDGPLLDYTQEQQDDLLEKIGANVGDKIRVILMKE